MIGTSMRFPGRIMMKDKGRTFHVYLPAGAAEMVRRVARSEGYRSPAHFLQAIALNQLEEYDQAPWCMGALRPDATKGYDKRNGCWGWR